MITLKNSIAILCLFLFSIQLHAQKKFIRLGTEAVAALDFNEAVTQFRKALSKNEESSEAIIGLARAYSQLNKFSQAEFYYEKAIKSGDVEDEDILDFAMNLLKNKNLDKAKKWFSSYNNSNAKDIRAANYIMAINDMENLMANPDGYQVSGIAANGYENDISPAFMNSKLVFSSDRDNENGRYNFYSINTSSDSKALPILHKMNVDRSETSIHFSNGTNAFMTNGSVHHSLANQTKVFGTDAALWSAEFRNGAWREMNALSVNSQGYYFTDPYLSADGNSLYFSSDMPGGMGGMDIYVSYKDGSGWSDPINLGEQINTLGHERNPFIDIVGKLYFSSDGLGGLGGLDVFTAEYEGADWKKAENMGHPINSEYNDMGLVMSADLKEGYYSSNRKGKGKYDIYYLTSGAQEVLISTLTGTISDRVNSEPIDGVKMKITKNGVLVNTTNTDTDGVYTFNIAEEGDYEVAAFKLGYKIQDYKITLVSEDSQTKDLTLLPFDEPDMMGKVVKSKDLSDEDVLAIKANPDIELEEEDEIAEAIKVVQESKEILAKKEAEVAQEEAKAKEPIVAKVESTEESKNEELEVALEETETMAETEIAKLDENVETAVYEESEGWRARRNKKKNNEDLDKVETTETELVEKEQELIEEVIEEKIEKTEIITHTETVKVNPDNSKKAEDYFKVKDEENTVFIPDTPAKKSETKVEEVASKEMEDNNIDIISEVITESIQAEKKETVPMKEVAKEKEVITEIIEETILESEKVIVSVQAENVEEVKSEELTELPMAKTYPITDTKPAEAYKSSTTRESKVEKITGGSVYDLPMAKTYPITESSISNPTVNTWTAAESIYESNPVSTPASTSYSTETTTYNSQPTYITEAAPVYSNEKKYKDYPSGNWTPPTTAYSSGTISNSGSYISDVAPTSSPVGYGTDLVYKVQVGAFSKQKSTADNFFNSAGTVEEEYSNDGLYKYTTGYFTSMKEANALRRKLSKSGYKGAFVVPYQYGSRISLEEAWRIIKGR